MCGTFCRADEGELTGGRRDKNRVGNFTLVADKNCGARRPRFYRRKMTDRPGARERRERAAIGQRWCIGCHAWLPAAAVLNKGRCREHERAEARRLYAENESHRQERRAHAARRKRGVEPVPVEAKEMLLESFEGECAYCPAPAATWDHVIAITKGGRTEPGNILPCCSACNSSKRTRDLIDWLELTGRTIKPYAVELLSHFQVL